MSAGASTGRLVAGVRLMKIKHPFGFWLMLVAALLAYPVFRNMMLNARLHAMAANGRSIQRVLHAEEEMPKELTRPHVSFMYFPRSTGDFSFASSTEYFRWIVTNRIITVDFSFFSGPGLNSERGLRFSDQNNAWCLVADYDQHTPPYYPFLFTRNIDIKTLSDGLCFNEERPFGKSGAAVVTISGNMYAFSEDEAKAFFADIVASNKVLRP